MDTVVQCYERGIKLKKLVPNADVPIVDIKKAGDIRKLNQSYRGQRVSLFFDIAVARQLPSPFFTPYHFDYRGRLVPLTTFNFQRQDHVRAMFQFHEGQVLTAEGLRWLKVHVANCGDFTKVSKKSFEARVAWVDANHEALLGYATDPFEDLTWTSADKPFLFLAACRAYADALDGLPVHLPVAFDGSCSGLQHLCAMTRDLAGSLVNLMPGEAPADIYATVARAVEQFVKADTGNAFASMWLKGDGITRKTVKQQVMTLAYGVTGNGMTDQSMVNTMEDLNTTALLEGIPNPFSLPMTTKQGVHIEDDGGFQASVYMTGMIMEAVKGVVGRPMEAMEFLRGIARVAADDNRPMRWTTPLGFPVILHYAQTSDERIRLTGADGGIFKPMVREFLDEIDSKGAADAAAPGYVHSLDGCHLQMVANACAAEGIELGTVHDSFAAHPNHAARLRGHLVEQFHALYQNDVLANVRDEALEQTGHMVTVPQGSARGLPLVPVVPGYGELDLDQVLGAEYAFS
ncbi:MAG: DNA-directed RNA polymerase [Methylocella sp.]